MLEKKIIQTMKCKLCYTDEYQINSKKEISYDMRFLYCCMFNFKDKNRQLDRGIVIWLELLDVYLLTLISTPVLQAQVSGYKATLSLEDACAQLK